MADDISTEWTGHDLLDINGRKIGIVEDVRFGDVTGGLKWLVVKTGLFGIRKVLVPAGDVRATENALVVPFTKDRVKDAPGVREKAVFDVAAERDACSYYGLQYTAGSTGAPEEGCVGEGIEPLAGPADQEPPPSPTNPPPPPLTHPSPPPAEPPPSGD